MGSKIAFPAQLAVTIQWASLFKKEEGGYCKYCILFGQAPSSVPNFTGSLVTHPLTNLQKANEKLREHFTGLGSNSARKYMYHLAAVEKAENFKCVIEKKQVSIDQQLSSI